MKGVPDRSAKHVWQIQTGFRDAWRSTSEQSHLARLKARRRMWLNVHLYLGLFAGALLVVFGLTGSILAFWQEIDAWLNPELHQVAASPEGRTAYRPLSELVQAADTAVPPGSKRSIVYYPRSPDLAFWFFYQGPAAAPEEADTLNVFVDPYTGKVTGTRLWYHAQNPLKHCFMGFMFKLHYALLLGKTGGLLVGILAVLLIVSVLTGLIVWWPLTGKWRQALTIKPRASPERFNHDLHKTFGFYSALVMLAVLISGVYFNLPEQFLWLVERFSTVSRPKDFLSEPGSGRVPISPDEAAARIHRAYAEERLYWFSIPDTEHGTYVFALQKPVAGLFTGRHQVVMDRYSGEVLADLSPASGNGGQMFVQWQWSLHSGHALGMTGRILVFLTGLTCPVIFVTGVIRWIQKRRAARRVEERVANAS
jgi:uncharacterized iron-regulated membrane protein